MKTSALRALACAALLVAALNAFDPTAASAHMRRHSRRTARAIVREQPLDLSPVAIEPYVVSTETDPKLKAWKTKMNLEDGIAVKGTRYITNSDVTSRELFVLQITQSLEGGYDSVNMYDRGIASWGLMQWASHSGSLDHALLYMKTRLQQENQGALWHKLFVANGLDVQPGAGITLYGKAPGMDLSARRVALRGSAIPGKIDPNTANHWAMVLARAGRQPQIQALEVEYAGKVVDGVLGARLSGLPYHLTGRDGLTVQDLVAGNPYAAALVFVLWTNNPRHAWQYVADAARSARKAGISNDPSLWPSDAFSYALLARCKSSHFGNWQQRASMIESRALAVRIASASDLTPFEQQYQTVLAQRKVVRAYELASRHQVELRKQGLSLVALAKRSRSTLKKKTETAATPEPAKPLKDERTVLRAVAAAPAATVASQTPKPPVIAPIPIAVQPAAATTRIAGTPVLAPNLPAAQSAASPAASNLLAPAVVPATTGH